MGGDRCWFGKRIAAGGGRELRHGDLLSQACRCAEYGIVCSLCQISLCFFIVLRTALFGGLFPTLSLTHDSENLIVCDLC